MKLSAVLAVLCLPVMTQAQGICTELTQMLEGSFEPEIHPDLAGNMICGTSRGMAGQVVQHCRWPFPFRAIEATTAFEELTQQVAHCLDQDATPPEERDVNHPDTYGQRLFKSPDGTVSVALKDKGALQQTFVFLRVEAVVAQ